MFCYDGVNIYMPVKHKFIIFEKMNDILIILVDFFVEIFHDFDRFFATWIRIRLTKMKRIRIRNTAFSQAITYKTDPSRNAAEGKRRPVKRTKISENFLGR